MSAISQWFKDHATAVRWIKVSALSSIGGGIAGAVAAAQDPAKYKFPQDFGSGKLLPFFFQGAALTFGAMLLKSPLGKRVIGGVKESKEQLAEDTELIEQTKKELTDAPKKRKE